MRANNSFGHINESESSVISSNDDNRYTNCRSRNWNVWHRRRAMIFIYHTDHAYESPLGDSCLVMNIHNPVMHRWRYQARVVRFVLERRNIRFYLDFFEYSESHSWYSLQWGCPLWMQDIAEADFCSLVEIWRSWSLKTSLSLTCLHCCRLATTTHPSLLVPQGMRNPSVTHEWPRKAAVCLAASYLAVALSNVP